MNKTKNKSIGAILLIAGCAIGAGMLGLPVMTGAAGFIPSVIFFVLAWAFMATTGVLLGDLVLSFDTPQINLITLAEKCLGSFGKWITWILFSLLFYAIMVAYTIAGGHLIADVISVCFGIDVSVQITRIILVAVLFFALLRGVGFVDFFNRLLMIGLVICYILLIGVGSSHVELKYLERMNFSASFFALPILVISFGYHNLIPSIATYLERKKSLLRRSIILGSVIPLAIYLFWEFVILGIIPFQTAEEWHEARNGGEIITQVLARACGSETVAHIARGFAFFAIATSFLPVALSFFDFLRDGFHIQQKKVNRAVLALAVLLPPYLIAETNPNYFLVALNYAGGFCAVILFGFLPALMAWKKKIWDRKILVVLLITSLAILGIQLIQELMRIAI
jgi:tyrosine-specific transport protein